MRDISGKGKQLGKVYGAKWALWSAARRGNVAEVRQLLADGGHRGERRSADIEERGGVRKGTPLHHASFGGHTSVVLLLLEHGANVSSTDTDGATALHEAALNGHEQVAWLLMEHGSDVLATDTSGETPLLWAASGGHAAVVQRLLDHGANVSTEGSNGGSPLHWAAINGHAEAVRLLMEHGADVNPKPKTRTLKTEP